MKISFSKQIYSFRIKVHHFITSSLSNRQSRCYGQDLRYVTTLGNLYAYVQKPPIFIPTIVIKDDKILDEMEEAKED